MEHQSINAQSQASLVPAVHLSNPFAVIYFVTISFWVPSHRLRVPCDGSVMVVHMIGVLIYWRPNSCLVVILYMLLTRHACMRWDKGYACALN